MQFRLDYPLNVWLIDLRDVIAKREFIKKADALLEVVEEAEMFYDLYEGGASPMAAYQEYLNKE